MDLPRDSEQKKQFVTNVGLITTHGAKGDDIMASEWTHMLSYSPGIISVSIGNGKTSGKNIKKTKEFGVSLAAFDQNTLSSVAGGNSALVVDKIAILKDLGFKFFKGTKTKTLLVEGASMNVECKLVKAINLGTHTTYIGEVVAVHPTSGKPPLIYHAGSYWKFGEQMHRPSEEEMAKINAVVEKHKIK